MPKDSKTAAEGAAIEVDTRVFMGLYRGMTEPQRASFILLASDHLEAEERNAPVQARRAVDLLKAMQKRPE